jgi:regulator of protease activity HflC (stomatin/prohibitin superfamily)
VEAGQPQVTPGEENTLLKIGGPGYVVIAPGNVVLFEKLTGPASVRPAGRHFVSRFERIADIVNLDEQLGKSSHKATTREGIPVEARNVTFRYRILPGKRFSGPAGRAMIDPYPFSNKAIIDRAYNRNVRADGLMPWDAAVTNVIDTALTAYIANNTLDDLISLGLSNQESPSITRELVQKALFSPATRNNLRGFGVELVFCDIGHFAINDADLEREVQSLRTNTWKARWIGAANKTRSDAEARRQAFQELARAEVQAEMLMSIAHALEAAGLKKDSPSFENMDNIILMRTAQIIEAIGEPIQKET